MADQASGFELLMPSNWRTLRSGDPLWVTLYGDHKSSIEADVTSGTMQDYALPAVPRDPDLTTNLAVYVRPLTAGQTLEQLGDIYAKTLQGYSDQILTRDTIELSAGPAIRLTVNQPAANNATHVDQRLLVYVLSGAGRAYYFTFFSGVSTSDQYSGEFTCMAQSLKFTTP